MYERDDSEVGATMTPHTLQRDTYVRVRAFTPSSAARGRTNMQTGLSHPDPAGSL